MHKHAFFDLSAVIGIVIVVTLYFGYLFPLEILNPLFTEWVFNGEFVLYDLATHSIGAMFYAQDEWFLPPGKMLNIGGPASPSVFYFASSFNLAFPAKILAKLFDVTFFQFVGLQIYIGFVLTPIAMYFLAKKMGLKVAAIILVVLLSVFPVTLLRVWNNDSLAWQFLIPWSFYVLIARDLSFKARAIHWSLIFFTAVSTNTYFFVMVLGVFIGDMIVTAWFDRDYLKQVLRLVAGAALLSVFTQYIIGGLETFPYMGKAGLHEAENFSANMLQFVDSFGFGYSQKLSPLPSFEGLNYLGIVATALVFFAFAVGGRNLLTETHEIGLKSLDARQGAVVMLALVSVGFFLLSLGPVLRFGTTELNLNLPNFLLSQLSTFRSLGRFGWVPFYALIIVAGFGLQWLFTGTKFEKSMAVPACLAIILALFHHAEIRTYTHLISTDSRRLFYSTNNNFESLGYLEKMKKTVLTVPAYDGNPEYKFPWGGIYKRALEIGAEFPNYNLGSARRDTNYTDIWHPRSVVEFHECKINKDATYIMRLGIFEPHLENCDTEMEILFKNEVYTIINFK